ncbi:uncharacterized protein [Venturia canescens]|uniref:uncharacterized protein n=1 Tax=Venturia canescens TaxID=32260 RepID=UPI001C9C019D|nr:uncharacterized protein LOC122408179 [Venturia canescens]
MSRYASTSFFTTILLVNFALVFSSQRDYDVRKLGDENLLFTQDDALPQHELTRLIEEKRETRFIGDLVVGERRADETIFRRTVEVSNPTEDVYSTAINLSVTNGGIIHYMSMLNEKGSYAVACDEPYSLGKSQSNFYIRVLPNSKSTLTMVVAAH